MIAVRRFARTPAPPSTRTHPRVVLSRLLIAFSRERHPGENESGSDEPRCRNSFSERCDAAGAAR